MAHKSVAGWLLKKASHPGGVRGEWRDQSNQLLQTPRAHHYIKGSHLQPRHSGAHPTHRTIPLSHIRSLVLPLSLSFSLSLYLSLSFTLSLYLSLLFAFSLYISLSFTLSLSLSLFHSLAPFGSVVDRNK